LEVPIPYIFGLFFRPMFAGISPQNMALYGTVPPFYNGDTRGKHIRVAST
jgi:hypothetical protein